MEFPKTIIEFVKAAMLRLGDFPPTIFVNGTKGKIFIPVQLDGNTSIARAQKLFDTGAEFAKSSTWGELEYVYFVCTAWMSSPSQGDYVRPSQDPNRMEVVMMVGIDARSEQEFSIAYRITRDDKTGVIELTKLPFPSDLSVQSMLLPSFLKGYRKHSR